MGSHVAVKDVSIRMTKGSFLSLLGPSGCGKTPLQHIEATPRKRSSIHHGVSHQGSDGYLCYNLAKCDRAALSLTSGGTNGFSPFARQTS